MGTTCSAFTETTPILCFSHLRWNFVYQRPQHLLTRAARHRTVFFFEEGIFSDTVEPHLDKTKSPEGVWVVTPVLPVGMNAPQTTRALRGLVDELIGEIGRPDLAVWYYTPMALPFSRHLKTSLCVYDNMDELSAFTGADPRMVAMERELFRKADIVFTGGQSLYESKKKRHANVHAFPSSIDVPHFAKSRRADLSDPQDQASIPFPRVGFFGVIDERMDIALVEAAASLRPDWQFVMLGPVVKIDPAVLPQRPNIHWLGPKNYSDLPLYLAGWNLGFMPFALNDATRFISPTKTPEFLAAGLPVISTAIDDVIRPYGESGLVAIVSSSEELVTKGDELLVLPKGDWLRKVDLHLAGMSWDATWADMISLMNKCRPRGANVATATMEDAIHV